MAETGSAEATPPAAVQAAPTAAPAPAATPALQGRRQLKARRQGIGSASIKLPQPLPQLQIFGTLQQADQRSQWSRALQQLQQDAQAAGRAAVGQGPLLRQRCGAVLQWHQAAEEAERLRREEAQRQRLAALKSSDMQVGGGAGAGAGASLEAARVGVQVKLGCM
jgi:hypothetical protein